MEFRDLFWVEGDGDVGDDVIAAQPSIQPSGREKTTLTLADGLSNSLPEEVRFFESQLKLFASTTTSIEQLVSIVMVTLLQKYPNVTQTKLRSMYDASKSVLAQLHRARVSTNDGVIDGKSASIRSERDCVVSAIAKCEVELTTLDKRREELETTYAKYDQQKKEFAEHVSKEHTRLQNHLEGQIGILTSHSEDT